MPASAPLLDVDSLAVRFPLRSGVVEAVRSVSFSLDRQRLAVVGESGSGKSQMARAIIGLTPAPGVVTASRLTFDGIDLLRASKAQWRRLRGKRIAIVMQDPKYSLNPVMRIGEQIVESLRTHARVSHREAKERALAALAAVKIERPKRVYDLHPHEVSGGMGQRAVIAMALIAEPTLVIADEPTSSLDVTVRYEILRILDDLVSGQGMSLILISHDLKLVSSFCDRVLVMYGGRVMETLGSSDLTAARHPYTRGLYGCLPSLTEIHRPLPTLVRDPAWLR